MPPDALNTLETMLFVLMGAGLILSLAGLWISFNQEKLTD
jgi:hypothetical protein